MARDLLSGAEDRTLELRAFPCPLYVRHVEESEFVANLSGSGLVAEQNDLHLRMEKFPTPQRVSLDDPDLSFERLGSREERQHSGAPFRNSAVGIGRTLGCRNFLFH